MKMDEDGNFSVRNEKITLGTPISLDETNVDVMMVLSAAIASLGIISNLTVVVVFLRNNKLRIKIPNIFIINQVRKNFVIQNYHLLEHVCPIDNRWPAAQEIPVSWKTVL